MDDPEVKELIDYARELEGQVIDATQTKQYSFEDKLTELIREIYLDINNTLANDEEAQRFGETPRVDYEEAVKNLKKYLMEFARDNNFRL